MYIASKLSQKRNPCQIIGWSAVLFLLTSVAAPISASPSKRFSPNQNDFYSTVGVGVSEEDLKKADDLRLKTIDSIKQLLNDKSVKGNRAFELHLRLGELFAERHDYVRDLEIRRYEEAHAKWIAAGKKGKEPKLSERASKAELVKAANAFRVLVTKFPNHKRTAAALFSLGKTISRMGNENSILYFERIVKNHGNSELVPDAHLASGEYYFDKHQINKAIDAYQAAMKFRDHRAYPYMVYKLGWAYFNATPKNPQEAEEFSGKAITAFKLVIKLADRDKLEFGRINLREEALRDLVMAWADAGDVDSAWEYFRTLGETEHFYNMLETLGNMYAEQGKNERGVAVFRRLITEAPTRKTNPENFARVAAMNEMLGNEKQVVRDLREMRKLFVEDSDWTNANSADSARIQEARRVVETSTFKYGALFHKRGQKSKNKALLATAASIYEEYLTGFPNGPNAYDVRYYLADLHFDFGEYESASNHFSQVVELKPKDGKYAKDSALNAVLALDKADQQVKSPKLPKPGSVREPLEIPEMKQKLIKASDRFVELFPAAPEGDPMRFTAAQIHFNFGHYPESIRRFIQIVEDRPKTEQAKHALKVVLAFHSDNQDWQGVTDLARRFATNKAVVAAGHAPVISSSLKAALFERALSLEKQKKYAAAAKRFVSYQNEFATDANADRALYNASLNYYRIGNVEEALKVAGILIATYPKSTVVPDVILTSAESHEALAQFSEASELYEKYALTYPNQKSAPTALYNAALIRKGLEQRDNSLKLFSRFVQLYKNHELAAASAFEKAKLHEALGQDQDAIAAYSSHAQMVAGKDDDGELYSRAKSAQITFIKLDPSRGSQMLREVRNRLVAKGAPAAFDARKIVSETLFNSLESQFAKFQALKVNDPSKIEQQVQAKQSGLERLAGQYQEVMKVGNGEYAVASLYRLGEMHENFSAVLFASPAPPNSSQLDIDRFKSEIEKVAFPLKEEAYKFYETAYTRSREVESFSDWTKRTYEKMSQLSPNKNPEVVELTTTPEYISHRLSCDKDLERMAK